MAFDDFEGRLDGEQHRIPSEQIYRTVGRAAFNTVYVVDSDAYVIDTDGLVYVDPDVCVYGEDEDSHPLEEFLEMSEVGEVVLLVRTEIGYVLDVSEIFDEDLTPHFPFTLTEAERARMGKVIAFVETREAAERLYQAMSERFGVEFADQANGLLATVASIAPEEDAS